VPAEYRIDVELGVVFSYASGCLTDAELLEHQRHLRRDPVFRPDLNQLFDFRTVTDVQVTAVGIRTLAARSPFGSGARRAFVVASHAMYGMMRMFEILTDKRPDELRVLFQDVESARAWLGLPTGHGNAA
jgi:hypothetical protein